jgi:hypothetical protein
VCYSAPQQEDWFRNVKFTSKVLSRFVCEKLVGVGVGVVTDKRQETRERKNFEMLEEKNHRKLN